MTKTIEEMKNEIVALQAENAVLQKQLDLAAACDAAIRHKLADIRAIGNRITAEYERATDSLSVALAERDYWRDVAERCFAAAMRNAVALADERKGERGE